MTNLRTLQLAAWASLALVAFAALAPIELRPTSALPPTVERFAAFAGVGFAFALAYPRQFWTAALIVIVATFLLEALQVLSPSRHGRLADATVKLIGGAAGLMVGWVLLWWETRRGQAAERARAQSEMRSGLQTHTSYSTSSLRKQGPIATDRRIEEQKAIQTIRIACDTEYGSLPSQGRH